MLPPDALVLAQNTPKCVWRPGYARTRWESLSAPPDPLAAKGGLLLRGGGGEGREGGDGREGEGREKGGEGRDFAEPIKMWLLRPCKVSKAFERSTKTPTEIWLGCVVLFIG